MKKTNTTATATNKTTATEKERAYQNKVSEVEKVVKKYAKEMYKENTTKTGFITTIPKLYINVRNNGVQVYTNSEVFKRLNKTDYEKASTKMSRPGTAHDKHTIKISYDKFDNAMQHFFSSKAKTAKTASNTEKKTTSQKKKTAPSKSKK